MSRSIKVIGEDKITTTFVLLFMACVWGLFIQSAFTQTYREWYLLLLYGRVALVVLALVYVVLIRIFSISNALFHYFLVCMALQGVYGYLEPSSQIEFYQYCYYLLLLAVLSYNGGLRKFISYYTLPILGCLIFPVFGKDSNLYSSVGVFAFNFTTPIAITVVSVLILKLATDKYEVLTKNIELQREMYAQSQRSREEIKSELEKLKIELKHEITKNTRFKVARQVAHDVRSPIAALKVLLKVDQGLSSEVREILDSVVERITGITNDLLNSERNQEEQLCNVEKVVKDLVLEEKVHRENISIEYRVENKEVKIPSSVLTRVLANLIGNAADAMNGIGKVYLETINKDEGLFLHVWDRGPGLDPSIKSNYLEEGVTSKREGYGLGLSYISNVLQENGGRLLPIVREGNRTKVSVVLPVVV